MANVNCVAVSLRKGSLTVGETTTAYVDVCPENACYEVAWESSNPCVASVSSLGVVFANCAGRVKIIASVTDVVSGKVTTAFNWLVVSESSSGTEDETGTGTGTANIPVQSVTVCPSTMELTLGESAVLDVTVCPENATNSEVIWSSSNTNVAVVNPQSGLIVTQCSGSVKIRATASDGSGKFDECSITVKPRVAVQSVTVCPSSLKMIIGETAFLTVSVCPENAANKNVVWTSSNPQVASVNYHSGKITALTKGIAYITAQSAENNKIKATVPVYVNPYVPVEDIAIQTDIYMQVGEHVKLTAEFTPEDATNKNVTWNNTNESVVSVLTGGILYALSTGNAEITAQSVANNTIVSETCPVTVIDPSKVVDANEVIQENAAYIINAANMFGLDPASVAMCIYAEQCLNYTWTDEVIDPMLPSSFDASLGIGQVKISTAKRVEDAGYLPVTHFTEWHGNNSIEDRDQGIIYKLLDPQENAKYVAGYLALLIDLWKEAYPLVESDTAILATLYNRGENGRGSGPHSNPKNNGFGGFASRNHEFLGQLLEQD